MGLVKLNDRGVRNATTFGSVGGGSFTFIKKLTSDGSDDDLSFVDGTSDVVLDDTYKEYMFICNNIHPETNTSDFQFQGNAAGGSGYDETITSTAFKSGHDEGDTGGQAKIQYETGSDLAQGTGFQTLGIYSGSDNDQSTSGYLHLFNPSSTTFVKHFVARIQSAQANDYSFDTYIAGYFNTTSAIDEIQFKFASGEIQAGTISLYGIK